MMPEILLLSNRESSLSKDLERSDKSKASAQSGKLSLYTESAGAQLSKEPDTEKPAFLKPQDKPPQPQNKSTTLSRCIHLPPPAQ